MSVELEVKYKGSLNCEVRHLPSGSIIITEPPVDNGGNGTLFSPTDLVAAALGSCIVTIMAMAAKKSGVELGDISARVSKDMHSEPQRRIGELKVAVMVPNWRNIPEEERKKIERAAMTCPVKHSLHPDIKLMLTFEYPD